MKLSILVLVVSLSLAGCRNTSPANSGGAGAAGMAGTTAAAAGIAALATAGDRSVEPSAGAGPRAGTGAVNAGTSAAGSGGGGGGANASAGSSGSAGDHDTGGTGDTSGTSGSGGGQPGCGANLLPVPEDPKLRGPWTVGVRTVTIGRLTAEVFYPAEPGSTDGMPEATYDIRDWLPPEEKAKVPDANSPAVKPIGGNLFRDAPIDAKHGPYPVVVMIHGTSSFRIASGSTNTHWASRGFVVIAADYPGLGLRDQLSTTLECGYPATGEQDIAADVQAQIAAMTDATGMLAFLAGRVDMSRLGISGHSQGACMAAVLSDLPNVQIILPMTGSTNASPSGSLKSIMWIAGMDDTVIGYDQPLIGNVVCPGNPGPAISNVAAYNDSPGAPTIKRLVGITGGGHLVPSDLCQKNAQGRNAIEEAQQDGVCGISSAVIIGLPALFDCGTIEMEKGIEAVNYASTAALEETLHCKNRDAQFTNLRTNLPQVGDFQHTP
jgi:dienelactone hydrolase